MTADPRKFLEEALKLPPEARAALAGSLIESLDDQVDEDAEATWAAEIAKRVADMDNGRVRPTPWSDAHRAIGEA